jgi:DNA repair/transcription protein MET18/MMS19
MLLNVLGAISDVNTKALEDTTLPLLFNSLPSYGPPRTAHAERAKSRNVLASLATLCLQPTLFETLVIRLYAKLDLIYAPSRQQDPEVDAECDSAYACAILITLRDVLQQKVEKRHADVPKYAESLGEPLFWLFIRGSTTPVHSSANAETLSTITSDSRVISAAGKIISILIRSLASESVHLHLCSCLHDAN